jgi:hypothetical protein
LGALRLLGTQVVVLFVLALPAAAFANDFQDVYREYKRTNTIKACKFSDKKLANAERQTPPDVEQYAPSFLDSLQAARERGADCGKKAAPTPAPTQTTATPPTASTPTPVPSTPTPSPTTPTAAPPPAPTVPSQPKVDVPSPPVAGVRKDDTAPAAVWLLVVLAALALLSAVFAGLAWWFGWSPDRITRPWRASWGEFGGRVSDLGVEFRDWLRTGS